MRIDKGCLMIFLRGLKDRTKSLVDALYEALYDFVDGKLTSADYPAKNQSYGMLKFVDNGEMSTCRV